MLENVVIAMVSCGVPEYTYVYSISDLIGVLLHMSAHWEDNIIIAGTKTQFKTLEPVAKQTPVEDISKLANLTLPKSLLKYEKKDSQPLPSAEDREYHSGENHYKYWLSGLSDYTKISFTIKKAGIKLNKKSRILDFGSGSGRILRHFCAYTKTEAWGCDINENHVQWCNQSLRPDATVFQNTALPHLQIEDDFFDVIYAVSVFTHIDAFETAWLNELRRVLRPGGILYITINDERSWKTMPRDSGLGLTLSQHQNFKKEWLETGFPGEKLVTRTGNTNKPVSTVFYKEDYVRRVWGKYFKILDVVEQANNHETALILRKV